MLLLIMAVVLATYSMANPSKITDPAESLVGYWPLNGNVEDEIGNHNGKLLGGAKFVKDADRDQVLELDGKDGRAEVPHADDLSFSELYLNRLGTCLDKTRTLGWDCNQKPR